MILEALQEPLEVQAGGTETRPLRVLHVITRLDRGGSTTNTLLTVAGLSPGFRPHLAYGRTQDFPPLAVELRGTVEMTEIAELVREISPLKDLVALGKLYRLIRRGKFDLVHTHSSKAGFLGRVAARLAGVPAIVHTPHGHVFGGYFDAARTRLYVLLERWAATFTDRIIGLTEQEVRDHLELRIGTRARFVSIASGVELERFRAPSLGSEVRAALGLPPDAFLIGSVGRLEPVKGHMYLLEAFTTLAPRFPNLFLALAGEGELSGALRDFARGSGFSDRMRFLGWREDIPALVHAFDLFALPSLNEGMGRALVEAMAASLPIVAARAGGISEVLAGGAAGLLVEAADAGALARGIEELLVNPELRRGLGEAARERARGYSVDGMLEQIEALYLDLLGKETAP